LLGIIPYCHEAGISKIKIQKAKLQIKFQKEKREIFAFCTVILIFDI
jgi:hypothetical protein